MPLNLDGPRPTAGTRDSPGEIDVPGILMFDVAPGGRVLVVRTVSDIDRGLHVRIGWRRGL